MEITFDTLNDRLILLIDGIEKTYYRQDKNQYISDTGRVADVIAIGW